MVFGRGFRGRYFWLQNSKRGVGVHRLAYPRKEKCLSQSRVGKPRIVIYLNGLSLVYIYYIHIVKYIIY